MDAALCGIVPNYIYASNNKDMECISNYWIQRGITFLISEKFMFTESIKTRKGKRLYKNNHFRKTILHKSIIIIENIFDYFLQILLTDIITHNVSCQRTYMTSTDIVTSNYLYQLMDVEEIFWKNNIQKKIVRPKICCSIHPTGLKNTFFYYKKNKLNSYLNPTIPFYINKSLLFFQKNTLKVKK